MYSMQIKDDEGVPEGLDRAIALLTRPVAKLNTQTERLESDPLEMSTFPFLADGSVENMTYMWRQHTLIRCSGC